MPLSTTIAAFSTQGFGSAGSPIGLGWITAGTGANVSYPEYAYAISVNSTGDLFIPVKDQVYDPVAGSTDYAVLSKLNNINGHMSFNKFVRNNTYLGAYLSASYNSCAVDSAGNIYACGKATRMVGSVGTGAYLIVKYDSSGTVQWQREIENAGTAEESGVDIDVDSSGNVFVVGERFVSPNRYVTAIKLDTNGTLLWQKSIDIPSNAIDTVACNIVDGSGNMYALIHGAGKAFLIKLTTSGTVAWTYTVISSIAQQWNSAMSILGNTLCIGLGSGYIKVDISGATPTISQQRAVTETCSNVGTAMDSSSNTYVLVSALLHDSYNSILMKYNSSGTLMWSNELYTSMSSAGPSVGNFFPVGIVYYNNNLFVTCQSSNDIFAMKFPADGKIPGKGIYPLSLPTNNFTVYYKTIPLTPTTTTYALTSDTLTVSAGASTNYTVTLTTGDMSWDWYYRPI